MSGRVVKLSELAEIAQHARSEGRKLVATNGCFDLLHVGHVRYLQKARELGDALVVGINGDDSVRALKGAGRPLNTEADRAEVIAALGCVDYVAIFLEVRASEFLRAAQPAVYVKGGDYKPETLNAEERAVLAEVGSEVRILPFEEGYSTTDLLKRRAELGSK